MHWRHPPKLLLLMLLLQGSFLTLVAYRWFAHSIDDCIRLFCNSNANEKLPAMFTLFIHQGLGLESINQCSVFYKKLMGIYKTPCQGRVHLQKRYTVTEVHP